MSSMNEDEVSVVSPSVDTFSASSIGAPMNSMGRNQVDFAEQPVANPNPKKKKDQAALVLRRGNHMTFKDFIKESLGVLQHPHLSYYAGQPASHVLYGGQGYVRSALVDLHTGKNIKTASVGTGPNAPTSFEFNPHFPQIKSSNKIGVIKSHPLGGTLTPDDLKQMVSKKYSEIVTINKSGAGAFKIMPWPQTFFEKLHTINFNVLNRLFDILRTRRVFSSEDTYYEAKFHCMNLFLQQNKIITYTLYGMDRLHDMAVSELKKGLNQFTPQELQSFIKEIGGINMLDAKQSRFVDPTKLISN